MTVSAHRTFVDVHEYFIFPEMDRESRRERETKKGEKVR